MSKPTHSNNGTAAAAGVQPRLALGPVSTHEIYPLDVFKRLTGLAGTALRQARRRGLRVSKVGRRHFVSGVDFARYLEQEAGLVTAADS